MGIGTSLGAFFDSPFHQQSGLPQINEPKDNNVLDPAINDLNTEDQNEIQPPSRNEESGIAIHPVGWKPKAPVLEPDVPRADLAAEWARIMRQPSNIMENHLADDTSGNPNPEAPAALVTHNDGTQSTYHPSARNEGESDTDYALRAIHEVLSQDYTPPETRSFEETHPEGSSPDHPDFTQAVDEYHQMLQEHSAAAGPHWLPRGIQENESLRDFAAREVDRADPNLRYMGHIADRQNAAVSESEENERRRSLEEHVSNIFSRNRDLNERDLFRQVPFIDDESAERTARNFIRHHGHNWNDLDEDYQRRFINAARVHLENEHSSHHADEYAGTEASLINNPRAWDTVRDSIALRRNRGQERANKEFTDNPDNVTKFRSVEILSPNSNYSEDTIHSSRMNLLIRNSEGKVADLNYRLRNSGKEIYVNWLGTAGHSEPNTMGPREMADTIRYLKQIHPEAETIAGFRVSGVRGRTGSNTARMRLRPAAQEAAE